MNSEERAKRWESGEGYNRYVTSEFESFRKEAWKRQILDHFPNRTNLSILDVGCGPGFFSCILSEEGHTVTAIDSSDGMLACARENARKFGVSPTFLHMDITDLRFEDNTFDVLVMRNVTWTLQFPEETYAQFKRILKPYGTLLIFDANWQMHFFDDELMKRVRAREKRHFQKYGRREVVSSGDLEYYKTAPLTSIYRPTWDKTTLERLGFEVSITENIGEHLYEEWEKELYGESPLFEVCAVKQPEGVALDNMRTYWNRRSESFGFVSDEDELRSIGNRICRYLPKRHLKVLDVGTGPGSIACAMALMGHDVTGIDLASDMIERARQGAAAKGLSIRFMNTRADELPFDDDTFDVVVSRNLTWALPDPEGTFAQWQRVVKPGGTVVYLDGNHYLYFHDEEARRARELVTEKLGTPHGKEAADSFDYSLCDETARDLPLSKFDRPSEWDEIALPKLGFDIIGKEVFTPQRLLAQGVYDMGYYTSFLIAARNNKACAAQASNAASEE